MENTKSYVTVHKMTPELVEDFEFEFSTQSADLLQEMVPNEGDWGDLVWGIDLEEYEYNYKNETMELILNTKWESPVEWLRNASLRSYFFENKLLTMTTIQKDETLVTGVAVMDGEVLQNKTIWSMQIEEVAKYYDDATDYDLDDLDNQIWDSIGKFVNVCERFYLEKEEKND